MYSLTYLLRKKMISESNYEYVCGFFFFIISGLFHCLFFLYDLNFVLVHATSEQNMHSNWQISHHIVPHTD